MARSVIWPSHSKLFICTAFCQTVHVFFCQAQAQINMGLQEKPSIVVPWADNSVSLSIISMLYIYGLNWGFNYQSFLINGILLGIGAWRDDYRVSTCHCWIRHHTRTWILGHWKQFGSTLLSGPKCTLLLHVASLQNHGYDFVPFKVFYRSSMLWSRNNLRPLIGMRFEI